MRLKGTFHFTKAAIRPMMKARYGRIVNLSSVVGAEATRAHPLGPRRRTRGHREGDPFPVVGRVLLHHRPHPERQRRGVHVMDYELSEVQTEMQAAARQAALRFFKPARMRDAKITQIYEGTNQIQRNEIAMMRIKEPASAEKAAS